MKIVVVGGVAAGASVAARARRLDERAEIVVLERGHHVSFANCGLPYHVGEVIADRSRLMLQTPASLRESLAIEVRTGHEVVAIDRDARTVRVREVDGGHEYDEPYDALALCPGAEPVRPDLPGVDDPRVHVLRRVGDMDRIKALVDEAVHGYAAGERGPLRAVVIGAGYVGLEMTENLHRRGAQLVLVEKADQTLPPVDHELSVAIEQHLRLQGVDVRLSTAAAAFDPRPDHVRVELTDATVVRADLVVLAVGVRPSTGLAVAAGLALGPNGGIAVDEHLRTTDPHIWAAGDAVETPHPVLPGTHRVPLAGPAGRQGRVVAENICGRATVWTGSQGSSVVKVFDLVAGGTGATERQLLAAGVPHRAVHVHPSGHATYYPGTAPMHLKVLFDPTDGRLLGAQAVGRDGVDKRLDVLATALRLRATVFDLEQLELAYAPPFGSSKDPVNMAGFVAANVVRGDLRLWYAQDYPAAVEGALLVDVRTPEEFELWHVPGAENVPLPYLRQACEDWDPAVPVRLYCAVGFRSYLAYRALVQRGFADVAVLSGGSTTFRAWHDLRGDETDETVMTPYAEAEEILAATRARDAAALGSGRRVELDCSGLASPTPLLLLAEALAASQPGDEVRLRVTDWGFASDAPVWAARHGHLLVSLETQDPGYVATFRKGVPPAAPTPAGRYSFVVFSGDVDKVLGAFVLATGALAMGEQVSMFFTFWGLNALRRPDERRHGAVAALPTGAERLTRAQLHLQGTPAERARQVVRGDAVPSLAELVATARAGGARFVADTMSMDLLGLDRDDLVDGVELGGVATFLGESQQATSTLFV